MVEFVVMASYLEYLKQAMRRAEYERLEDGSGFYAHIPGFDGLWANGATIEDTRNELFDALDGWLYVNTFVSQLPPPILEGVELAPPSRSSD
jgi:predicted RNase H-like HicB family nuclease